MGFRIESLDVMKQITSDMDATALEVNTKIKETTNTLSSLTKMISGGGVDRALININSKLRSVTNEAISVLGETSDFINTQMVMYATNEKKTVSDLAQVDSLLDGLEV